MQTTALLRGEKKNGDFFIYSLLISRLVMPKRRCRSTTMFLAHRRQLILTETPSVYLTKKFNSSHDFNDRINWKCTWQVKDLHGDERCEVTILIGVREIIRRESNVRVVLQNHVVTFRCIHFGARNPDVFLDLVMQNITKNQSVYKIDWQIDDRHYVLPHQREVSGWLVSNSLASQVPPIRFLL